LLHSLLSSIIHQECVCVCVCASMSMSVSVCVCVYAPCLEHPLENIRYNNSDGVTQDLARTITSLIKVTGHHVEGQLRGSVYVCVCVCVCMSVCVCVCMSVS